MQSLIAGNWKMFKTVREAELFTRRLVAELEIPPGREVVIAPSFTALCAVAAVLRRSAIKLAAQNVHDQIQGAFTGEVSAGMLIDAGCEYVIIGHSERRAFFGETDDLINRKLSAALARGLKPIFCIGETLAEREQGATLTIIAGQIKEGLKNINLGDIGNVTIAYEPVWAIGTGKTAAPEQAQEVHAFIRSTMEDNYGKELAGKLRIIYGGSVNSGNIGKLMSEKDINGALVGGASLDAGSFSEIVKYKEV
ncbi:MAG: triose-phosphate isomerase [Syntrophales bacterium]